ncbi:hypothetical protein E2C01_012396 [Portunus trituberculatus]|uniref:Uncharacterized protein n=1 Tax=Portunus trituberculatus TaxID=210409 RepID=A0A5B7DDL9_PORTR|nr:hypothetical protein [Portunus trituberculatus]
MAGRVPGRRGGAPNGGGGGGGDGAVLGRKALRADGRVVVTQLPRAAALPQQSRVAALWRPPTQPLCQIPIVPEVA